MSTNGDLPKAKDLQARVPTHRSAKSLSNAIFKADVPEEFVKSLPGISAYLAVRANGLESSTDLLQILSIEQYQACLDLDLWEKDTLSEDQFFNWLASTEEKEDFKALHKFLRMIDMRIVGAIVGRNTHSVVFEDPSEQPPGPNYYTPDKGYTWISLHFEDPERVRLFGRLLAYIFENNTELFYQLLSLPTVNTPAELEEACFTERVARLADQGFPDRDSALEANSPADRESLIARIKNQAKHAAVENIAVIEPVLSGVKSVEPLGSLITQLKDSPKLLSSFEIELSWLTNCAFLIRGMPHGDFEAVQEVIDQVRGAINLGLEDLIGATATPALQIFEAVGLKDLHRLGIFHLRKLRRQARSLPDESLRRVSSEGEVFSVIAQAREDFPFVPLALNRDGTFAKEGEKLILGRKAFETLAEIKTVSEIVSRFIQ